MNIKRQINNLDKNLVKVIKRIGALADKQGFRACLVGGFIRDILLNIKNFDVDIILEREGIRFAQILSKRLKADLIIHRRFGTAALSLGGLKIDIATFRKEAYPYPGSLPIVFSGSLADDLARRDFSINALACSINKDDFGQISDYFQGLVDLKQRRLRVMHANSFIDDPTRILRIVRFKARLQFAFHPDTLRLLRQAKRRRVLERMQAHRIRDELVLIFKEARPELAMEGLKDIYGLKFIHKDLTFRKAQMRKHFLAVRRSRHWFEKNFPRRRKLDLWLMYFIVFLSGLKLSQMKKITRQFALRAGESLRILSFMRSLDRVEQRLNKASVQASDVYNILHPLSYEVILLIFSLSRSPKVRAYIYEFFKNYNLVRIKLGGEDLKRLNLRPGPRYKELLSKVLDAKLNLGLSNKHEELAFLKKLIKK